MSRHDASAPIAPAGVADGWQERAACRGEDPHLFEELPARPKMADRRRINDARKICMRCPVIEDCLVFAVVNHESGVWGGMYLSFGTPARSVPRTVSA